MEESEKPNQTMKQLRSYQQQAGRSHYNVYRSQLVGGTDRRLEDVRKGKARVFLPLPVFPTGCQLNGVLEQMLPLGLSVSLKKVEKREGMDHRAKRPRISP